MVKPHEFEQSRHTPDNLVVFIDGARSKFSEVSERDIFQRNVYAICGVRFQFLIGLAGEVGIIIKYGDRVGMYVRWQPKQEDIRKRFDTIEHMNGQDDIERGTDRLTILMNADKNTVAIHSLVDGSPIEQALVSFSGG